MDITATLETDASPVALFRCIDDLVRYPEWLDIVPSTTPAPPLDGDEGPAWFVTLRGKLGPLARAKRLRMVRTRHETPSLVRFERREGDGREHAPWVLDGAVTDSPAGATLTMGLHYGGSLWVPLLDRLLTGEIERSRPRLASLAAAEPS